MDYTKLILGIGWSRLLEYPSHAHGTTIMFCKHKCKASVLILLHGDLPNARIAGRPHSIADREVARIIIFAKVYNSVKYAQCVHNIILESYSICISVFTVILHPLTDTSLAAHVIGGPWWSEENPRKWRNVGSKFFSFDQVFGSFDAIVCIVGTFTSSFRHWR